MIFPCPTSEDHRRWEYLGPETSGLMLVLTFRCLECGHEREEVLDFSGLTLNISDPSGS